MKLISAVLIIILSYQQGISQVYVGDKKNINQILENGKNFSKHVMNSNHKMIGQSYTKDAKIFPERTKIIAGEELIMKYWKQPEGTSTSHHKIIPEEITIVENTAYDYGYYEGTTRKSNGDEIHWGGKYVIVWKKVGNDWKIYLDIWNSID